MVDGSKQTDIIESSLQDKMIVVKNYIQHYNNEQEYKYQINLIKIYKTVLTFSTCI
jgi:hypothetical protein